MKHPGVGPERGTEAAAEATPPARTEHRPVKAARRSARGPGPSVRPPSGSNLGTRVQDLPYRYKPHMARGEANARRLP